MQLIPALDLKAGRCVRLLRGDFEAETRYDAEPLALLAKYRDLGADWLHVVDLDGARDGSTGNRALIADLAAQDAVKLQVGGGLRNSDAVAEMLDLGVDRVVVGSAALIRADQVRTWLNTLDPSRSHWPSTCAWTRRARRAWPPMGGGGNPHCRCGTRWRASCMTIFTMYCAPTSAATERSRDPTSNFMPRRVRRFPRIAWQASGGIRDARDLRALAECGAAAAISGKALLEELIPIEELRTFLPNA